MYKSLAIACLALSSLSLITAAPSPAAASEPQAELKKRDSYSGQATYFEVGLGACGWTNSDSDMIVAVNEAQYEAGNCGKWLTITNTDNKKTVSAKAVDKCPGCSYGSLDLSPAAFGNLTDNDFDLGVFPITWSWN